MTVRGGRDWTKMIAIIIAALSLLSNVGWAMYGMSQQAKQATEDRLRNVEIMLSRHGAMLESRR